MKKSLLQFFSLLIILSFTLNSCTVTVDDDSPEPVNMISLTEMNTFGWVYSEIEFKGSGFAESCGNVTATLINATGSFDLEILECTENTIIAWIPENQAEGDYEVVLNVDGLALSVLDNDLLEVKVKIRPVVLTLSSTEIASSGTFDITGLYIINLSDNPVHDPKVWITKVGYTNTVSEISVNDEGTAATIILDDIAPGVYNFRITCVEWSNEFEITIL